MIYTNIPTGCVAQEVELKNYAYGYERATRLRELMGKNAEAVMQQRSYVLEDSLIHDLKSKGINCHGEVNLLSPKSWHTLKQNLQPKEEALKNWHDSGYEPVGVLLTEAEHQEVKKVSNGNYQNFEQAFQICEHLFFYRKQKLKVLLQTRPRV